MFYIGVVFSREGERGLGIHNNSYSSIESGYLGREPDRTAKQVFECIIIDCQSMKTTPSTSYIKFRRAPNQKVEHDKVLGCMCSIFISDLRNKLLNS